MYWPGLHLSLSHFMYNIYIVMYLVLNSDLYTYPSYSYVYAARKFFFQTASVVVHISFQHCQCHSW